MLEAIHKAVDAKTHLVADPQQHAKLLTAERARHRKHQLVAEQALELLEVQINQISYSFSRVDYNSAKT